MGVTRILSLVVVALILAAVSGSLFTVNQTQQALV